MFLSSLYERFIAPLLFPQQNECPICQRFLGGTACLCSVCESQLKKQRLADEKALFRVPPVRNCLSVYAYKGAARQMVHLLKYRSAVSLSQPLGEAMCMRLIHQRALYKRIDLVIPVPLHPSRQEERGYNQAELLAKVLCETCRMPLQPEVLVRVKKTGSQVGRTRVQRMEAMRHVFAVTDGHAVKDKCILLVDDVFTTGATALSCADALYAAGAQEVAVITVCRA